MQKNTILKGQAEHVSQSQKLDSIGTLAGGVAHDFNNILSIIIGACTLLEQKVGDKSEQMTLVNLISSSAERAAKLTQSLLTFSRRKTVRKKYEDLGIVVKVMQDFLVRIVGEDILLTTYVSDETLMVMIDRGQIEQVMMNLVVNARDAMPHGGILNISVSQAEIDGSQLESDECQPGNYALITVSDSGEGIDSTTQQRVFEPFFTTKEMNTGSGLGLSVVYGIIRLHNGVINVCSEPGEGTTFKIYLPL